MNFHKLFELRPGYFVITYNNQRIRADYAAKYMMSLADQLSLA
jgi:hypothetical protein